jgi:hypothetical protein
MRVRPCHAVGGAVLAAHVHEGAGQDADHVLEEGVALDLDGEEIRAVVSLDSAGVGH